MKAKPVRFFDGTLWQSAWGRRSEELTPLYIERYMGPRHANAASSHTYWELICVSSGFGRLAGKVPLDLTPGTLCLVPPGMDHAERSDGKLDTIWIGLKGRHLSGQPATHIRQVQNQALANRVEQLWLFAVQQSGPIGPELDAFTAGIIAFFSRVLTEGTEASGAADALERAVLLFHGKFFQKLSLAEIAGRLGYSASHFDRAFKRRTGHTPIDYLTGIRIRHAKHLLEYTDLPIAQVAVQAGYEDQLYFSRVFRKTAGLAPSAYRQQTRQTP